MTRTVTEPDLVTHSPEETMTTVDMDERDRIKQIVCDTLEVEPDEVSDDSLFVEDHDADSMRLIEILSALELQLGVTIDQREMPRMVNLAGVYEVIAELRR
jgi:acyl carrier protein